MSSKDAEKDVERVIKNVEETLKTAEFGLDDLINERPERKLAGLRNLIVFGRAVTNVLQNLRSIEPEFDEWYEKYVKEMKEDDLMRYFYKLRSQIIKEGVLKRIPAAHIKKLKLPDDMNKLRSDAPPNAKEFFIGDEYSGSGWIIQLPDGSLENTM